PPMSTLLPVSTNARVEMFPREWERLPPASKAPTSHRPDAGGGRGYPRWSAFKTAPILSVQPFGLPPLISPLPLTRPIVCVGPPLFCSGPSLGLACEKEPLIVQLLVSETML